ncbi:MAG: hypothetical protein FWG62_01250 [Proteobacteria bacterium]|nr:hypothetical protein [Pseudomonadota bacterium]
MNEMYDYRNCQSLFGYAYSVHLRSGGVCQLCGAGRNAEPSFDFWRQLTVEHIIGRKQGGYRNDIKRLISELLPESDADEQKELALAIDAANTITACSFCNATTSRYKTNSMRELIEEAISESRQPEAIIERIRAAIRQTLYDKRKNVAWKLKSVRSQYEKEFLPSLLFPPDHISAF